MADVSTGLSNIYQSISGSINFTGLGSGTDFSSIVDQLVELESLQMTRMETWRATWEEKIESMQSLNQRLSALQEAAGTLDTESEFMVRQASTSDSTKVTAIGTASASTGAYTIEVAADSKHILSSAGVADTSAVISAGATSDLILELNGTQHTISITAGSTLAEVVDAINTYFDGSANEITASAVSDGTTSNPYHLELKANTGGEDYQISVVKSPLLVSLDHHDAAKYVSLSGGTTTSSVSVGGQFTGSKVNSPGGQGYYQYDISLAGGSDVTVGTDAFTLNYSVTTDSGVENGSVDVAADYVAGDNIVIHDLGLTISLSAGVIATGDSMSVLAYANDIDDAELSTGWNGPAVTTDGNYLGSVNKTYNFTVMNGGALDTGNARVLRWTDSQGNTGTVSVTDSDTNYEVEQGVYVSLASGTDLGEGQTFSVNVYAPDKQQAQAQGLAQVTKVVHSGFTDSTSSAVTSASATLSFTYAGQQVDVAVPAGATLSQLVTFINTDPNNPGVVASIINDGRGLPDSYKLVLTGSDSGAAYQITDVSHNFTGTFDDSSGDVGGGFSRTQWGTNAMLKVDGFPAEADEYLQRSENVISDVITGVAVDLHDSGTAVITISVNTSAIVSNVEAFINAVNYAQDFIREETAYNATDDSKSGILIGNYSYYILKSRIDSVLNTGVEDLASDAAYTHLSQIGITTNPDDEGRWEIDGSKLIAALGADPDAVADLFIFNDTYLSDGVAKKMFDEMTEMTDSEDGMLNVLIDNYTGIIDNIDDKIAYEQRRLETYRERQLERFARLESLLAELNSEGTAIESQISSLPKVGGNKSS